MQQVSLACVIVGMLRQVILSTQWPKQDATLAN